MAKKKRKALALKEIDSTETKGLDGFLYEYIEEIGWAVLASLLIYIFVATLILMGYVVCAGGNIPVSEIPHILYYVCFALLVAVFAFDIHFLRVTKRAIKLNVLDAGKARVHAIVGTIIFVVGVLLLLIIGARG